MLSVGCEGRGIPAFFIMAYSKCLERMQPDPLKVALSCGDCDLLLKEAEFLACGHASCLYCSINRCGICHAQSHSRTPAVALRRLVAMYKDNVIKGAGYEHVECDYKPLWYYDRPSASELMSDVACPEDEALGEVVEMKVLWRNGRREFFTVKRDYYVALHLTVSLWSMITLLRRTPIYKNPVRLMRAYDVEDWGRESTPISSLFGDGNYWNVPIDLIDLMLNSERHIGDDTWPEMMHLLVKLVISISVEPHARLGYPFYKNYMSILHLKKFLSELDFSVLARGPSERGNMLWETFFNNPITCGCKKFPTSTPIDQMIDHSLCTELPSPNHGAFYALGMWDMWQHVLKNKPGVDEEEACECHAASTHECMCDCVTITQETKDSLLQELAQLEALIGDLKGQFDRFGEEDLSDDEVFEEARIENEPTETKLVG